MNKTIMHVNYGEIVIRSYGKRTVDDICKIASEIGFDGVEFRGVPPKELASLPFKEYATQIADAKKKSGLSEILFGIGVYECANKDEEVRAKAISEAVEKAKIASELCGTTVCNAFGSEIRSSIPSAPPRAFEFHGSGAATPEDWKLTVDTFQQIGKGLEKVGVKFAFETHMLYIHDVPEQVMKLVNMIDSPAIGVNMDYGNTAYFANHPSVEETIDMYGHKLFYTHLKNSTSVPGTNMRMPTALGEGEINHRLYLAKLKEVGFTGPIGIEAPRPGDRIWYAKNDFAYFKSLIASL